MPEPTLAYAQPTLLNPRKLRRDNEVAVDLGDGTFIRARREDMTLLVFEGRIPMPLLSAVTKMIEMPDASPADRVAALGAEHGKSLVDVLRSHACKVSIEPIIVMQDDGNQDHLPVAFLDVPKLMAIWSATAMVPKVGQTAAATFRSGAGADDAPVGADGGGVPPAAEPVVAGPPAPAPGPVTGRRRAPVEKFISR